jgi:signal transduction histidine kinase
MAAAGTGRWSRRVRVVWSLMRGADVDVAEVRSWGVAALHDARAPDGAAVMAGDGDWWWRWALAAGLLLAALYALGPSEPVWLRELVVYPAAEAVAVVAVLVGVGRYRPSAPFAWLLIAAGLVAYLVGDVIWGVYATLDRDPFPSLADGFYLAAYPLIAAGLVVAVMRRRPLGVDRRALIDTSLVAVIAGFLAWVYLVQPVLDDPDLSQSEALVAVAYPLGDLLLLAVATRFVMGSSWNVPSLRLLVAGLGLTLIGDVMFALSVVEGSPGIRVLDTTLLVGIVTMGVAGLHPSMTALTEELGDPADRGDALRVALLAAAFVVIPVVLVVQEVRDEPLHLLAATTAMILVSGLVAARVLYITGSAGRSARREATLSRYAAELLSASGRDELFAAAQRAANELVREGQAQLVVSPGRNSEGVGHAFTADVEVRGEHVAELVADPSPARLRHVRDSLATVATQLSLALERDRLLATEREAAETLTVQNERLRELDRMKDSFVSSVSHELRTPLTSMVGYLEILRDGEAGELNDDQQHCLEIVDRNCHRLNDLIGDILVTARVDSGQFSLERGPVNLGDIAAVHVESIRATARSKGVEVALIVNDDPPWLDADEMRLGQLLDNLLSNAVKFTPGGGTVSVTVATRGPFAHFEVADTGVGIPADELDNLFSRFFRASTARTVAGTGLGLSIAKSIAEAHGGTIAVMSEVGAGTTFIVDLPSRTDPGPPVETSPRTEVSA